MIIGVPKEIKTREYRVGLVPAGAKAFINVRFEPASGVDLGVDGPKTTYSGPRDIPVGAPVLKHIRRTCDFEATLPMAAGVESLNVSVATAIALYELCVRPKSGGTSGGVRGG